MSRCCCHSFTVSLTFELPSDRGKKKDKKSLPYPGLKTNLFFVCCEVFAIAIQLLTKKNKKRQLKKNGDVPLHIVELQA